MNKHMKILQHTSIALLMSLASSNAFADNIATEQIGGGYLSLSPSVAYDKAHLNVGGISASFNAGETISANLFELSDGIYQYQLTLTTEALESNDESIQEWSSVEQSGQLRIISGNASAYSDDMADEEATEEKELNDIAAVDTEDLPPNNDDL